MEGNLNLKNPIMPKHFSLMKCKVVSPSPVSPSTALAWTSMVELYNTLWSTRGQSGVSMSDHDCVWLENIVVLIVSGVGRMLPPFPLCVYVSAHIATAVQLTVTRCFFKLAVASWVCIEMRACGNFTKWLQCFLDACCGLKLPTWTPGAFSLNQNCSALPEHGSSEYGQ